MRAYPPPLQDPQSFSNLYDRTQIIIFRFIYGLHGGPVEEVEDLTCDTYLRAWNGRHRFTGDEHDALCWLFTIARRLVIDAYRRKKAHHIDTVLRLDEIRYEDPQSDSETLEEQATTQEQFKHAWHLVQTLPLEKREMLVLRFMLGWKVKEIASYMRIEENTVSVYIKRCLEHIRNEWFAEEMTR